MSRVWIAPSGIKADRKALDFDGSTEHIADDNLSIVGIANTWTISSWVMFGDYASGREAFFDVAPASGLVNIINFNIYGHVASDPLVFVNYDSAGSIIKYWHYIGDVGDDTWYHLVATWDGTNPLVYKDAGALTVDAKPNDNAGTMTDTNRRIRIGTDASGGTGYFKGLVHSTALWNVVLDQSNITAVYNGGDPDLFDLKRNHGGYTQASALKHWWRLGIDSADFAKDEVATNGRNLGDDAANMTSDDIVTNSPGRPA